MLPHEDQFVSGLNVPDNFATLVGQREIGRFERRLAKVKKLLEARNG